MGRRGNLMLDDEAWEALQQTERGQRSRFLSEAVKRATLQRRRRRAVGRLDALRAGLRHPGGRAEEWGREDREAHRA